MKFFYTSICILLLSSLSLAQSTSVFVAAHPDDWQLFMNPNAYHAVADSNHTVIFLHITAGDAGAAMTNNYTLAREEGSKRAIRFMVNAAWPEKRLGSSMNEQRKRVADFDILSYTYRNTVSYFLRLPDGNVDGAGYPTHQYKSLQKLMNGEIETIQSADGTNTFSKLDLELVISVLIKEHHVGTDLSIHIADTDPVINPGDHSDHLNSSKLLQQIAQSFPGCTLNLYAEYHTRTLPNNVFPKEYELSVGTWGATASGLSDFGHYSTWDEVHNSWLGKQYVRSFKVLN
ncbi:MAG: PIG-L family deacetylase [Balneolaceae bacterium]|nr:PIG-L family deacetylase [Balneolaceae bacterium]